MRRLLLVFLSLVLILGILAPAALAKDDGSAGGGGSGFGNGGGGGGGGGGYVRRESGIWVPEYVQRSAPMASPTVKELGKELAKDTAKGVLKDAVKSGVTFAGGAIAAGAASALRSIKDSPTISFIRTYGAHILIPRPLGIAGGVHW